MKLPYYQIATIHNSLTQLSNLAMPCSYAISKNLRKTKKHFEKYLEELSDVRDKYVPLTNDNYKVLAEAKDKKNVGWTDFDAGEKQKEYLEEIEKVTKKEVKIDFYTISLNRELVLSEKKTVRLEDKLEAMDIPATLLEPLLEYIFEE